MSHFGLGDKPSQKEGLPIIHPSSIFYEFCKENNLGKFQNNIDNQYQDFILSKTDYQSLFSVAEVNLCFHGGLILGPSHQEKGIHVIQIFGNNLFRYIGEMQGSEYVSKPILKPEIGNLFFELNQRFDPHKFTWKASIDYIPEDCNLVKFKGEKLPILVITAHNHFIFNHHTTIKALDVILNIEKTA